MAQDADAVARLHQDERLRAHLVDDAPLDSMARAAHFIERLNEFYSARPGLGIWHASVGQRDGSQRFVGWFSLMPLSTLPGEIELGSRLCPDAWGTGLAMDGGESLMAYAFDTLQVTRVWGACDPANRGARLCLGALGFSAMGTAPYEGGSALYHELSSRHWWPWARRPRRNRLRLAAKALRDVSHANHGSTP